MSLRPPSIDSQLREIVDLSDEGLRQVAPMVRRYLADERAYLADLHEASRSGRQVNETNSDLIDRLVRRLFALAEEAMVKRGESITGDVCVVAVGGYARREMSIYSDVDLLLLYRGELTPYVATIAERLQHWLWDAGLTVGCATRTLEDTLVMGREDVTVRTAVLTARYLCGDGEFFHQFADSMRQELLTDVTDFICEQQEQRKARHVAFGESLFLLQPNLKEGAGALRDYHAAYWVARGAQPSLRNVDDLLHFGLLTEPEMDEYRAALDFLWRTRNQLHLLCGRLSDQMSFELQEQVAEKLGYGCMGDLPSSPDAEREASPEPSLLELRFEADDPDLPVERFMRDYYRHARAIQTYSDLVIEQCAARVDTARRSPAIEVEEGFLLSSGHLEIPHAAHLRERPLRLLLAFEVAQNHDVSLSRMAQRLIRENLDLIDDGRRGEPSFTACFLRILNAQRRVMRSLMLMNDVGLLAVLLPEWEHIVCRWQHVIYHTYTVDVHSIFLVEELRRLWRRKYEQAMPELTELMQEVDDRAVLFLGCLLHDIGKGFGGQHSEKGAHLARRCVGRLGLSPEQTERVIFLVRHHLLMSHLSQSRDLSDPKVMMETARLCGDRVNLRNLYLITFADIRASSRDAWTDWKGQLLSELYERSAEMLETGADDPDRAMELIEARVAERREGAREELKRLGVGAAKVEAYFEGMHRRYFITHTPKQIARHAQVALRYSEESRLATAIREMRGGYAEFILCTRDVHGLYSMVAGTLTALGFNILGSHVYTTRSSLALQFYRLSPPAGGPEEIELAFRQLEHTLGRVLAGEVSVDDLLRRRRRSSPASRPRLPSRKPPRVIVDNSESDFYTLVDVIADDRIGLLHDITAVIAQQQLEIYISKVATIKDQVTDTFYLKDQRGRKLRDPEAIEALRVALLEAVRPGDGQDGVGAGR